MISLRRGAAPLGAAAALAPRPGDRPCPRVVLRFHAWFRLFRTPRFHTSLRSRVCPSAVPTGSVSVRRGKTSPAPAFSAFEGFASAASASRAGQASCGGSRCRSDVEGAWPSSSLCRAVSPPVPCLMAAAAGRGAGATGRFPHGTLFNSPKTVWRSRDQNQERRNPKPRPLCCSAPRIKCATRSAIVTF